MDLFIAMRPGTRHLLEKDGNTGKVGFREFQIRAKVEHPFVILKDLSVTEKSDIAGWKKTPTEMKG